MFISGVESDNSNGHAEIKTVQVNDYNLMPDNKRTTQQIILGNTRKQQLASEAVHNPEAAAQRKIAKQLREKERKKRRVDERRGARGAIKKRRY